MVTKIPILLGVSVLICEPFLSGRLRAEFPGLSVLSDLINPLRLEGFSTKE